MYENVEVREEWKVTTPSMVGEKRNAWTLELHVTIEIAKHTLETQLTERLIAEDMDQMKTLAEDLFEEIGLNLTRAERRKELDRLAEWDGKYRFTLSGGDCPDTGEPTVVEITPVVLESKLMWKY